MYDSQFHKVDLSKYSFLITGGAGFIGSNIVEYLLKYNAGKVVVLDNLSTGFKQNIEPFMKLDNFEFIEGDITDYDTCLKVSKGIDYVSHQAALGSVPRSIENPLATHHANATGFLNVITAAKNNKVKRLVYASSSSVYGDSKILPKREEQIGNPLSPYAATKRMNELYAKAFTAVYDVQLIGLRYFNIFGPKQNPSGPYAAAIPLFIDAVRKNNPPFINGDGEQTRDFTFVENAVQANIKALFSQVNGAFGRVYNIALGERTSINELFEKIRDLYGSDIQAKYRDTRAGDVRDSLADIQDAYHLLGYTPTVKIDEGLKLTVEWFNKHMK